jgi:hypothetical protein
VGQPEVRIALAASDFDHRYPISAPPTPAGDDIVDDPVGVGELVDHLGRLVTVFEASEHEGERLRPRLIRMRCSEGRVSAPDTLDLLKYSCGRWRPSAGIMAGSDVDVRSQLAGVGLPMLQISRAGRQTAVGLRGAKPGRMDLLGEAVEDILADMKRRVDLGL